MVSKTVCGRYDNFSLDINDVPDEVLNQAVSGSKWRNPDLLPDGTEIEYATVERALESLDKRRDHERALDAATEAAVNLMDDRAYEVVLREVPYDISRFQEDYPSKSDRWFRGEIDLLLVDPWGGARGVEVKPHSGRPLDGDGNLVYSAPTHEEKAEKQHRQHAFAFRVMSDQYEDFDMRYVPRGTVFESELKPNHEVTDTWSGRCRGRDSAINGYLDSEQFRTLMDDLLYEEAGELLLEENRLEREDVRFSDFEIG